MGYSNPTFKRDALALPKSDFEGRCARVAPIQLRGAMQLWGTMRSGCQNPTFRRDAPGLPKFNFAARHARILQIQIRGAMQLGSPMRLGYPKPNFNARCARTVQIQP
jgi:hypothetical protein